MIWAGWCGLFVMRWWFSIWQFHCMHWCIESHRPTFSRSLLSGWGRAFTVILQLRVSRFCIHQPTRGFCMLYWYVLHSLYWIRTTINWHSWIFSATLIVICVSDHFPSSVSWQIMYLHFFLPNFGFSWLYRNQHKGVSLLSHGWWIHCWLCRWIYLFFLIFMENISRILI